MTTLKLRKDWEVRNGRWSLMIGSEKTGPLVSYDAQGACVRLYDTAGVYQCTLAVTADNWEQVAHAYFTKHKLVSPWEVEP